MKNKIMELWPKVIVGPHRYTPHVAHGWKDKIEDGRLQLRFKPRLLFVYQYPLGHAVVYRHTNWRGWSRQTLVNTIRRDYVKIYHHPTKNGIWGHSICDLVIERIRYNSKMLQITVDIGS